MQISCAFATASDTPNHVELAESLGYRRAWLYDSPAVITDVWMTLARCAERTNHIGLGPGVLVPSLRHPMVNAAAIAELAALAPGRVAIAVGTGFTGRLALGQRPIRWRDVADYVRCLKTLLSGETAEWEGARIRMLQLPGFGAPRPVDAPLLIAADGSRGWAVAAEVADGIFSVLPAQQVGHAGPNWRCQLVFGTVLADGEDQASPRVVETLASSAVLHYHRVYLLGGAAAVDELPGGHSWRKAIESYPADERHLAIHLVQPDRRHRPHLSRLSRPGMLIGTAAHVAERIVRLRADGVTEIVYQPAGPDIERELQAFADAAGLTIGRGQAVSPLAST